LGNHPHHEAAFVALELLEFDKHKETKGLFENPIFVISIGNPLTTNIAGFWKIISQKVKIKL